VSFVAWWDYLNRSVTGPNDDGSATTVMVEW